MEQVKKTHIAAEQFNKSSYKLNSKNLGPLYETIYHQELLDEQPKAKQAETLECNPKNCGICPCTLC